MTECVMYHIYPDNGNECSECGHKRESGTTEDCINSLKEFVDKGQKAIKAIDIILKAEDEKMGS